MLNCHITLYVINAYFLLKFVETLMIYQVIDYNNFYSGFGCIRGNIVCPQWCLVVDANGCKSCPCGPGKFSHQENMSVKCITP